MKYRIAASKNRKEVIEVVEGMKSVYNWQTIYKRNGFTVKDISRVR